MRASLRLWIAPIVLACFSTGQAADIPPAEVFGALPRLEEVSLSPDGNLLAWHDLTRPQSHVMIYDLKDRKYKIDLPLAHELKLRSIAWSDNTVVLVTVSLAFTYDKNWSASQYEVSRVIAVDIVKSSSKMLLMNAGGRMYVTGADVLAYHTPKPGTVVMASWDWSEVAGRTGYATRLADNRDASHWIQRVFEVDTRSGGGPKIADGNAYTAEWVVDRDGKVVARSDWDPVREVYTILVRRELAWDQIFREEHNGARTLHGLSADGLTILLSGVNEKGRAMLAGLPLQGGELKTVLDDPELDVSGLLYDPYTRVPVAAIMGGMDRPTRWLDKDAERRYQSVAKAFPGQTVEIYGRSKDYQRVVAKVESTSNPPVYYFVDFASGKADMVGEAYPALTNVHLGEVRAISYAARDGAMVPAYLTLPPASQRKNLPLVVLPHGGPEAHDAPVFNWLVQFLAVRGYAVLQPQFRGSTSFGEAWRKAGYRQWGRLMQDDVTDGVKALIEQGVADSRRVCIVGASYGGYAALAGAAFTPDMYRCAVSINGVSNLPEILAYEENHGGKDSNETQYWRDHIGAPGDPDVIAKSPSHAAYRVKAPILLMHATDDTVVPAGQSTTMAIALGEAGMAARLVKLNGDDHWLSRADTRVQVLKELEPFLAENLQVPPEASKSPAP